MFAARYHKSRLVWGLQAHLAQVHYKVWSLWDMAREKLHLGKPQLPPVDRDISNMWAIHHLSGPLAEVQP